MGSTSPSVELAGHRIQVVTGRPVTDLFGNDLGRELDARVDTGALASA
jgi:hypothetical protein